MDRKQNESATDEDSVVHNAVGVNDVDGHRDAADSVEHREVHHELMDKATADFQHSEHETNTSDGSE